MLKRAVLEFVLPNGVSEKEVTLTLFYGYPTRQRYSIKDLIEKELIHEILPQDDGKYIIDKHGMYCYRLVGEGFYSIVKLFHVTEEDFLNGSIKVNVAAEKFTAEKEGYQPCCQPAAAPANCPLHHRDKTLYLFTDEFLQAFPPILEKQYKTPAFMLNHAPHQFTTQDEMMEFLRNRADSFPKMKLFSLGETPNYGFDLPLVILSEEKLPADISWEQAADMLQNSGKLNAWYQAQIHGNEPAAGEGCLAVIDRFAEDENVQCLLQDINLIILPRANPEGSYLFTRSDGDGVNMNRDYIMLESPVLKKIHRAYVKFAPSAVLDTHEYIPYGADKDNYSDRVIFWDIADIRTSSAVSMNVNDDVKELSMQICGEVFAQAEEAGINIFHYTPSVNNATARTYFALEGCLSFLMETAGLGMGRDLFERRVNAQECGVIMYLESIARNASKIREALKSVRSDTIGKGRTQDDDNITHIMQLRSKTCRTPYSAQKKIFYSDGNLCEAREVALSMPDIRVRVRVRPTAYILDAKAEKKNEICALLQEHGVEYYEIPAGSKIEARQYFCDGPRPDGTGKPLDICADLREQAIVNFADGAVVIPMDQPRADLIAVMLEPDIFDSSKCGDTLFHYGLIDYDRQTQNFPLYGYYGKDARKL